MYFVTHRKGSPEWIITVGHQTFTNQLAEPVKDGQPLSAENDRYTLIEQSVILTEQSKKMYLKGLKKQKKVV